MAIIVWNHADLTLLSWNVGRRFARKHPSYNRQEFRDRLVYSVFTDMPFEVDDMGYWSAGSRGLWEELSWR